MRKNRIKLGLTLVLLGMAEFALSGPEELFQGAGYAYAERLKLGNTTLEIFYHTPALARERQKLDRWLRSAVTAVTGLYGRFPLDRVPVFIREADWGEGPVPFGMVKRDGGTKVIFYVQADYSADDFIDDWTATHEFSHLALPHIERSHSWLSEGIATYYQNVLRVRVGLMTPELGWLKLQQGFQRGLAETAKGVTLQDAVTRMRAERKFMRVYWTGTAFFLKADLALRQQTNGRESLDQALKKLRDCCLPSNKTWTGEEFIAWLDRATESRVFSGLYDETVNSDRFPDLHETYQTLGLKFGSQGVRFDDSAPQAQLRKHLMAGEYKGGAYSTD